MAMGRSRRSNFAYDFAELSAHFTFPLPLSSFHEISALIECAGTGRGFPLPENSFR